LDRLEEGKEEGHEEEGGEGLGVGRPEREREVLREGQERTRSDRDSLGKEKEEKHEVSDASKRQHKDMIYIDLSSCTVSVCPHAFVFAYMNVCNVCVSTCE